jgi:hypothetical protein
MTILDPNSRPGQAGCDAAKPKLMTLAIFGGGLLGPGFEPDVDAAAAEVQQAGYEVLRLPDKYRKYLYHPLDDFFEVYIEAPDDPEDVDEAIRAMTEEVDEIIDKYGGLCDCTGPVRPGHIPFADVFIDCD